MAREVQRFAVTIPTGTTRAGALTFTLAMPPRVVREIEVIVPPGPRGEVGFQIAQAGQQIFPTTPGQFIVTDNEEIHWPVEDANTSGAWQVIAYNTGTFNHTIEFRFLVDLPGSVDSGPGFQPLPADALSG